jgi:hypothetical protein
VLGNVTQEKLVAMLDKLVTEKPEFAALPGLKALGLQVAFPCPPRPLPPKK